MEMIRDEDIHQTSMGEPGETLKHFLSHWFEGSTGAIRFLLLANGEDKGKPYFYDSISEVPIKSTLSVKSNVYFNVSTLSDKNGTKDAISEVCGLWQDLDGKDYLKDKKHERAAELSDKGEGKGKWEKNPQTLSHDEFTELMGLIEKGKGVALSALNKVPSHLKPSFIIDTGKGYQAYWKFREPIRLNGANEFELIELLNKRLTILLGADHTGNINRLFRVPYTRNVKLKGWPLKTEILEFHPERRFNLSDFDGWLPEANSYQKIYEGEVDIKDIPADLPARFWSLLETNKKLKETWEGKREDLHDNSGSGLDMSLADLLVKNGFSDSEIARILLEAPYEKSSERTEAYLKHTIKKARSQTQEAEQKTESLNKTIYIISLDEIKEVFKRWLLLKDDNLIDVVLATVLVNYFLDHDPLWLLIVSASSGTKTEILRSLDGCKNIYFLSNLTKATLISGQKAKKDVSLLPKLTDQILVLKDFTTVLEMRADDQAEIFAQLREIYDGKYDKAFGTGKVFNWRGHVGILAGVTPVIDERISIKQILGERFILYRTVHEERKAMAKRAFDNEGSEKQMRAELHEAMKTFLNQIQPGAGLPGCPEEIKNKVVCLADITALARSSVPREGTGDRAIKYVPDPELPPRLAKQFKLLACGLSLVRGKTEVTEDEYHVLKKIALDTIPNQRKIVIKALLTDEWLKTREVADRIRYPVATTRILLEDLNVLGITDRQFEGGKSASEIYQNTPYEWAMNKDFFDNLAEAEINENDFNVR